jgi:hypothetical protein
MPQYNHHIGGPPFVDYLRLLIQDRLGYTSYPETIPLQPEEVPCYENKALTRE